MRRIPPVVLVVALSGCAVSGTQIQAECERTNPRFPDLVECTRANIAQRAPSKLSDPKAKLYLLKGQELAESVRSGRVSDIAARAEWQRLYVELWEDSQAQSAARAQALAKILQPQPVESTYKIVQPVPIQQAQPQPLMAQQAFWTGKSQAATSVTGVPGFNCEYQYAGQRFWRMQPGACPSAVDVR